MKPELFDEKEHEAISACIRGEREAFAYLVEKYRKRAYLMALKIVMNPEDALDLSQEAFIKAFKAMKSFREGADFKAWFYQILRNTCISHLRRRKARFYTDDNDSYLELFTMKANPEKEAENVQLKKAIWSALKKLSPARREVFMLREFEGMSYNEISKLLGISLDKVKGRLHYARQQLMMELEHFL